MSSTDTLRLNICLTPSGETAEQLVLLAKSLPENGQKFRIDGQERHPHLTALMGTFEASKLDEVLARLRQLPKIGLITCGAYGLTVSSNYYVEVGYNCSRELDRLQMSVAAAIAGLRYVQEDPMDPGMPELETSNQLAFGYKLFDEAYRPHVTLGSYERCDNLTLPLTDSFYHLDFTVEELTIAESDDFGSVVRIIDKMAL